MLSRRTVLAASASAPLSYLGLTSAWATIPKNVVVIAKQIDDIIGFDPAEAYEISGNEICGNCYRKLVIPDPQNYSRIAGDLAERWQVSADGLTFTFHLSRTAKFDSGKPVTAADAAFSLQRAVILNKTPGFIIGQFGFNKDNVEKLIRAADDQTLKLTLPAVQATSFVLYCLSANVGCVVEKSAALEHQTGSDLGNAWLKTHSAGAGPYKLGSWVADDHVIIAANPHYGQKVGARRIIIRHVADPGVQWLLLQKGDADIARDLGAEQLKLVTENPDYHLVQAPQAGSLYIAMNQNVPELTRLGVRQAIKWAIDYDSIARNITPGTWRVNESFLAGGLLGEVKEQPFHKDLAKARQLMADARLPGGFAVTMDHFSNAPFTEIAQVVQQNLEEIGIKVQLIAGEAKQVVTKTRARKHQLAMLTRAIDYFDANGGSQAFCSNPDDSDDSKLKVFAWRSHYVDPELTAAVAAAAKELDTAKRIVMYRSIQRTWWDRAPFAIMLQPNATSVLRKNVTGLAVGPLADYTKFQQITKS